MATSLLGTFILAAFVSIVLHFKFSKEGMSSSSIFLLQQYYQNYAIFVYSVASVCMLLTL